MKRVEMYEADDGQLFKSAEECARHEFVVKWAHEFYHGDGMKHAQTVLDRIAELCADAERVRSYRPAPTPFPCVQDEIGRAGPPTARPCEHLQYYGRDGRYFCSTCEAEVDLNHRRVA